ncbi:MAG: roadblock/LC7 domain-containing protein [Candidatus Saliniplasma sp.]
MVTSEDLDGILKALDRMGARGVAVLDKDGTHIASNLPGDISKNTFSIMCATVMGAAKTANSELDREPLEKVTIESKDRRIIMINAGQKLVLSVIVSSKANLDRVVESVSKAAKEIENKS